MNDAAQALARGRERTAVRVTLRSLASPRLTLTGFALLALAVWATANDTRVSSAWLALPALWLALNLLAAMVTHRALRRGGLGLFHAALLAAMVVAVWGRLHHFEGRVELVQGAELTAAAIEPTSIGPLNDAAWRRLQFEQGPWRVHYAPGVRRAQTLSQVRSGGQALSVGDTEPLVLQGHRFYTTHNKGFAPLLHWQAAAGGDAIVGAIHLPSYPLFDWKQEQRWRTPDGTELRLWLRPDAKPDERRAYVLAPDSMAATLVVELQGQRVELRAGESVSVAAGTLRFERLLGWMGYRVHFDPALQPLLAIALLGVAGLAWHLWGRRLQQRQTARAARRVTQ